MEEILLEAKKIVFVETDEGTKGAPAAFGRLESRLPSLKGRKFYGLVMPDGKYRAAVERSESDAPNIWGFSEGEIPAGKYLKGRVSDWGKNIPEIKRVFRSLELAGRPDNSRPRIEFYRSQRALVLLLPVL